MQNIIVKKDGYESIKYDSPDSLLYIKKLNLSDFPDKKILRHRHEDLEFIIVTSGKLFYTVNDKSSIIENGCGICVNSSRFHGGESIDGENCEFICILLNPALICTTKEIEDKYVLPIIDRNAKDIILLDNKIEWQKEIINILKNIYEIYSKTKNSLYIVGMFFSLWQIYYANLHNSEHADVIYENDDSYENGIRFTLKNMLVFIYENYGKRISLKEICAAGRICRSKCYEIFGKYLHDTPMDFLSDYRVYKALQYLRTSDMSILEIAYKTGFSTSSYFTEVFKDRIGCTPTEYRKNKDKIISAIKNPTSFSFFAEEHGGG